MLCSEIGWHDLQIRQVSGKFADCAAQFANWPDWQIGRNKYTYTHFRSPLGFDKIGPFFWHFMLLALPFFWPNYANFYALLAEKCSLMLDILNSNSVKHDLTINLITMAEYVPGMAAKIAGTLSYECIPTSIQSHAQRTTGTLSCTCTAPIRWKPIKLHY